MRTTIALTSSVATQNPKPSIIGFPKSTGAVPPPTTADANAAIAQMANR